MAVKSQDFYEGYEEALNLALAHWPEDRKCDCDPSLSGGEGFCFFYCWMKEIHEKLEEIRYIIG